MNYLSHFYLDHVAGNPYFNVGLLLPDIAKDQVKTFKVTVSDLIPVHKEIQLGCLRHYKSDKIFHASSFFMDNMHWINEELKNTAISNLVQRKWFIAHIMMELMVDRQIVKNEPAMVDDFYGNLLLVDEIQLNNYLLKFGAIDPENFIVRFNHFRTVKYIYYYADNNKFVYSLNRIMMRAGLQEMNQSDKSIMEKFIIEMETRYFSDYEKMKQNLIAVFA